MALGNTRIGLWLTNNCYILFSLLAFLTFYFDTPEIIRPTLFLIIMGFNITLIRKGGLNSVVLFYIIAAFLSLTGSLVRPYPISFFLTDMYWAYMPIVFYFVGYNSSDDYPTFYKRSLLAFMFIFLIGFYFLVFPTEKYLSKSLEILNLHSRYNEGTYMYARFASFLDSYHTSNLGVCSLCFSFGLLKYERKIANRALAIIAIIVSFVAIMLAQQRAAMYMSILLLIYYLFVHSKGNRFGGIVTILLLSLLLMLVVYYYLSIMGEDIFAQVIGRFSQENSSTMISSRSSQWRHAIDGFLIEPVFGLGVGSGGHLAVSSGLYPVVTDGSYFKILLEGGLASFIPFVIIVLSSLIKGFRHREKFYIEFPLLLFFTFSLVGANVIDMPYIIMFMWYVLGRINREEGKLLLIND